MMRRGPSGGGSHCKIPCPALTADFLLEAVRAGLPGTPEDGEQKKLEQLGLKSLPGPCPLCSARHGLVPALAREALCHRAARAGRFPRGCWSRSEAPPAGSRGAAPLPAVCAPQSPRSRVAAWPRPMRNHAGPASRPPTRVARSGRGGHTCQRRNRISSEEDAHEQHGGGGGARRTFSPRPGRPACLICGKTDSR